MARSGLEHQKELELRAALVASLDLRAVMRDAYPLLLKLVGADYGALAVSRSERADDYEWIVHQLEPAFLESYEEMVPHDFVRRSVLTNVNVVMRDSEMLERREIERNLLYNRAREVGSPIERVMAVMLYAEDSQSGLSLYRAGKKPFSEREQSILQRVTPVLASAVRNCQRFTKEKRSRELLEMALTSSRALIHLQSPTRELYRTASTTALLNRWFGPVEHGSRSLPRVVLEELAKAQAASARGEAGPWLWERQDDEAELLVDMVCRPTSGGEPSWVLTFCAVPHTPRLPHAWRDRLTDAECGVLTLMLRGWDDKEIAQERNLCESTVKVYVRRILDKLGLQDRKRVLAAFGRVEAHRLG